MLVQLHENYIVWNYYCIALGYCYNDEQRLSISLCNCYSEWVGEKIGYLFAKDLFALTHHK